MSRCSRSTTLPACSSSRCWLRPAGAQVVADRVEAVFDGQRRGSSTQIHDPLGPAGARRGSRSARRGPPSPAGRPRRTARGSGSAAALGSAPVGRARGRRRGRASSRAPPWRASPWPWISRPRSGAAAPHVSDHGRPLVGEALEVRHQRPQLSQERRQQVGSAADVVAPLRRRVARVVRLRRSSSPTRSALTRERSQCRVGVTRRGRSRILFCVASVFTTFSWAPRELPRIRPVDHLVELLARGPRARCRTRSGTRHRQALPGRAAA